jgi:hypothetical protein
MYLILYIRCNVLIIFFVKICHVEYRELDIHKSPNNGSFGYNDIYKSSIKVVRG